MVDVGKIGDSCNTITSVESSSVVTPQNDCTASFARRVNIPPLASVEINLEVNRCGLPHYYDDDKGNNTSLLTNSGCVLPIKRLASYENNDVIDPKDKRICVTQALVSKDKPVQLDGGSLLLEFKPPTSIDVSNAIEAKDFEQEYKKQIAISHIKVSNRESPSSTILVDASDDQSYSFNTENNSLNDSNEGSKIYKKRFEDRISIQDRSSVIPMTPRNCFRRSRTFTNARFSLPSEFTSDTFLPSLPTSPFRQSPRKLLHDFTNMPIPPLSDIIRTTSEETCRSLHRGKHHLGKTSEKTRRILSHSKNQIENYIQHATRKSETKGFLPEPLQFKVENRFVGIPSDHVYKFYWDIVTILVTCLSAYTMHLNVRDKSYEFSMVDLFTSIWFSVDVLLNFMLVERNTKGEVIEYKTTRSAKYLMTWFPIDVLSIYPWERLLLIPIIEQQKRRNIVVKWFFRSKAIVKVTRFLKGRHFKVFGRVAKESKRIGLGGKKLLAIIIRYVPKYLLFYRNMKAVILLKLLRQIHFAKKMYVRIKNKPLDDEFDDDDSVASLDDDR